jgi:sulfur-oxidizing protein SoxY
VLKPGVGVLMMVASTLAGADTQVPTLEGWPALRAQFYGAREMVEVGDKTMSIEAPASTPDPSATPVVVRFGPELTGRLKQLRVFIDNNPSPLVTTMNVTSALPVDEIDLRVRIDRFTSVRAIAETQDGQLQMRSTWVNASGGCSSPSSATEGGTLGQIRLRASNDDHTLQISIRHPNNSGFQTDPRTGELIPPHFVSDVRVLANGQAVLDAETGISLSENPSLRIDASRPLRGPLTIEATDTPTQARFTATWTPGGASTN